MSATSDYWDRNYPAVKYLNDLQGTIEAEPLALLYVQSPDETVYQIKVSDEGVLSAESPES